ncbi:MAG: DNA replication and repair protein RecF [Muribaculaceae bacterium]|nr:DNA replication and repair protein RecF [Muribaculaceae bacterium]
MILTHLDIVNFKNIHDAKLDFCTGVNCLLGKNGMGKSNLLEAIYFLSMSRPMSSLPESALITHGEEMLMIKGMYEMDNEVSEEVSCGIVKGKGKTLRRNGKEYDRISDHIGHFPVVTVTPADSELVTGSAEVRRRLMDMVISQADRAYLSLLIRYNKSLESRNRMLRSGLSDALLYEAIETQMGECAIAIHTARKQWVEEISEPFAHYYSDISGDAEKASITYKSVLNNQTPAEIFTDDRQKDLVLGYTSRGIHRDDLITGMGDYSMRRLGSQGQVKSYTVALRLAIFDYLKERSGITPLLLLDDIFDKLDSERVGRIMELVSSGHSFGQIFITDTNREHLDETVAPLKGESRLFEVSDGEFRTIAV